MSQANHHSALVAIYNHPEYYPPTQNATILLSEYFSKVFLHFRPNASASLSFPDNVFPTQWNHTELKNPGLFSKVFRFIGFTYRLFQLARENRPDWIIVHDPLALLSLYLVLFLYKKPSKLWYHNHDIPDKGTIRKYSIGWFAADIAPKIFSRLDLFSLPALERQRAFPMHLLKGRFIHIPNYPLKGYQQDQRQPAWDGAEIKLLFQGTITAGRGLEELIPILQEDINGARLTLTLIGPIDPEFKPRLNDLVVEHKVMNHVIIKGRMEYKPLLRETSHFHIGIATMKPEGSIYETGGTASNKIYEYARAGLPVIYYDSPHYNKHLGNYLWASPTDLSPGSTRTALEQITTDWESRSAAAKADFEKSLNFQTVFEKAMVIIAAQKSSSGFNKPSHAV